MVCPGFVVSRTRVWGYSVAFWILLCQCLRWYRSLVVSGLSSLYFSLDFASMQVLGSWGMCCISALSYGNLDLEPFMRK
ncbi:hypothetical protein QBC47DRAFT_373240 [Echria macrotheca]|uniref:Uncharacterized protein n=1 Tax=Echria macrotheca TaxID=438768 RepID=A0AAJ0F968_9PEZI|nr:hypothetical protein QBC47DRAFT_373240 [Echria macrotheca]